MLRFQSADVKIQTNRVFRPLTQTLTQLQTDTNAVDLPMALETRWTEPWRPAAPLLGANDPIALVYPSFCLLISSFPFLFFFSLSFFLSVKCVKLKNKKVRAGSSRWPFKLIWFFFEQIALNGSAELVTTRASFFAANYWRQTGLTTVWWRRF